MSAESKRILNLVRDKPDPRDYKHKSRLLDPGGPPLPVMVDLRPVCPPIIDQYGIGSCQSNCVANALMFDILKQGLSETLPSRLFIYYNVRALIGLQHGGEGESVRDTVKTVACLGWCEETLWPYIYPTLFMGMSGYIPCAPSDIGHTVYGSPSGASGILVNFDNTERWWVINPITGTFGSSGSDHCTIGAGAGVGDTTGIGNNINIKPPANCYEPANNHKNILYERVDQDLDSLKAVLAEGLPICYGANIYFDVFSGISQMPTYQETVIMNSSGYQNCDPTDVGKVVQFGTKQGILASYTNGTRTWVIDTKGSTYYVGDACTIKGGAGVGTITNASSESIAGGHATIIVGYDDGSTFGPNRFICMNSWGSGWGIGGYYTIPYEFVLDPTLAFDFWVIKSVT